jgi:hypothetical protein
MEHAPETTTTWEKTRTLGTLLASILIPSCCREKPQEESEAIRAWAIEILRRYSPVEVPQGALDQLKLVPPDGNTKSSRGLMGEVSDLTRKSERLTLDFGSLEKSLERGAGKSRCPCG